MSALALLVAGVLVWTVTALSLIRVAPSSAGSRVALRAELTPAERGAIRDGRVRFLDGRVALRLADRLGKARPADPGRDPREVLVILNPPAARAGSGERVLAITRAAVVLGARLMVDCTDADLARLTPEGRQSVLLAKRAGLWRMVVFDGAHHLPALASDPEILLLPVLTAGREPLVIHAFVRDALPLALLRRTLAAAGLEPLLLTLPRISLPLKEDLPLRLVALQALRRVAAEERRAGVSSGAGTGRRARAAGWTVQLPQGVHGWPVSVWDLLLRYPTALAGRPLPWTTTGGPGLKAREGGTSGQASNN